MAEEQSNKVVIIIEDEEALLDSYTEIIEDVDVKVVKCKDGYKGLDAISQNKGKIGMVILDLMMEGIDGLEVLRQIGADVEKYGTPSVVVLTNMVSEKVIEECLTLGAKSYLIKTEINSEDLVREVKKYL